MRTLGVDENAANQVEKANSARIFERLSSIVKTISRKEDIEIINTLPIQDKMRLLAEGQDPETAWFRSTQHDPQTKKVVREFVYLPPKMLRIPENIAMGKAAHEAGHVAITRYGEFVPDEVASELGFSSMLAAIEERPTDNVVRLTYPGAGQWVDEARLDSIREGDEMKEKFKGKTGNVPKFLQFNNLTVYGRFADKLSDIDSDVRELYAKLQKEIETIEKTVPNTDASEEHRLHLAQERYKKAYLRVWSEVKHLVEQDKDNEELRQMLNNALQQNMSQEELQQAAQDGSLEGKIQEMLQNLLNQSENSSSQSADGMPSEQEGVMSQIRKKLGLQGKQPKTSGPSESDVNQLAKQMAENISNDESESEKSQQESMPIPFNQMPEELKKALQEAFEALPEEEKAKIKQEAEKVLKELEDEITKSLQSELNSEANLPTHKELDDKQAEKKLKEEQLQRRQEVKKAMEEAERVSSALRDSQDVYDKIYEAIFKYEEELYRRLEEIFNPNLKKDVRLKSSGSRINLPAVYRRASQIGGGAPVVDNKVFETVHFPDKKDYAITLLVDLSGSMRDEKIRETFKGVVLLTEVLNRLGVKIEVLGFQDDVIEFKVFDEDLDNKIRKRMSGMIDEVEGNNPNGHNQYSYNDDGPCLKEAAERIDERKEREKFVFVLSDGLPEGRKSDESDLENAISNIKEQGSIKLLGLGLGGGTEHVKRFYGQTALPNIQVQELPLVLSELLMDIVQNPQKY
ncbi:MAG: VWA domain-containing protein [Nitrospinae bacterium]|nr:VWA domain-containing protein [Nitrospinota bacterium]